MCGIAGTVGLPCDASIAADLLATMRRRGPDGQGTYFHPQCTLLHARLAIVDLAGGMQPMSLPWAQEAYTITYNGELYNTQEIRKELEYLGHHFRGHSDTEVLLHAYAQWGEACLERLNGIYAFAVWEEHAKRLFLARDRMGVKPLFYKADGKSLIFASEIKTILAYPGVEAELDAQGALECRLSNVEVMGRDVSVVSRHESSLNPVIRSIIDAGNQIDLSAETVRFNIKPHKLFVFNKETEERIYL